MSGETDASQQIADYNRARIQQESMAEQARQQLYQNQLNEANRRRR